MGKVMGDIERMVDGSLDSRMKMFIITAVSTHLIHYYHIC